jgi:two-component system chemotaxis sensor kinase CheA
MPVNDPMLEVYLYENSQLLENLELVLLEGERNKTLESEQIDEIFRIMHTIKGSSAMMNFEKLSHVAHAIEDMFANIRERTPRAGDWDRIFDIVLNGADFIKAEMAKITAGQEPDGEADELIDVIRNYLGELSKRRVPPPEEKQRESGAEDEEYDEDALEMPGNFYRARLFFEQDCKMENIRAFGVVNDLTPRVYKIATLPEDLLAGDAAEQIVESGCTVFMKTEESPDTLRAIIAGAMFLRSFAFDKIDAKSDEIPVAIRDKEDRPAAAVTPAKSAKSATASADFAKQSFISVNINKLDSLMNLVGEIVTTESMVTAYADTAAGTASGDNFEKAAQQLRKLTDELQDIVMSIRMVPNSSTFHKMQRLVRDMSKKVNKDVDLVIIGEETEIDKSINDNLSDPLMHMIRNSMDHGIEPADIRAAAGKPVKGTITLEARNTGGDVMILVSDDGKGLNREVLLEKAEERGILTKSGSEMSDREVYNLIFAPGFSTKEAVTEFSGRGVGMDVVRRNIDNVGGSLAIESTLGQGMTTIIRIPLTLAIVDGMRVQVGENTFILPVLSIRNSFKPKEGDVFTDPDNNEMIMIRGEVFRILRLKRFFNMMEGEETLEEGIMIQIASDEGGMICLFVDKLIGEQQAVVKPIPSYIGRQAGKLPGISGCTVLGDGSISLILDINGLVMG